MLLGLGLGTLLGAAMLLKMALNVLLGRSATSARAKMLTLGGSSALELPPRLLTLARKTQGRKPGGLGMLGLKQRVSSRTLTALAFPLMNQQNAIEEADEEALLESPAASTPRAMLEALKGSISSGSREDHERR